jgi:hypothetical protein
LRKGASKKTFGLGESVVRTWLQSILVRIADRSLLPAASFAYPSQNAALNARDRDNNWESRWTRLYDEIERRWPGANVPEDLRTLAGDIRRESFLAVSRASGQSEIACYVSDDFDLIVRGRLLDVADPLLEQLWDAYERGKFPHPPL